MTKQELLTELGNKVEAILKEEPITNGLTDVNQYDIHCRILLQNGTMNIAAQPIIVEGEGTAQEAAYYGQTKIQSWSEDPFVTNVKAAIQTWLGADPNRKKAVVDQVNTEENFAIVTTYEDSGTGTVSTQTHYVNGNADETVEGRYDFAG